MPERIMVRGVLDWVRKGWVLVALAGMVRAAWAGPVLDELVAPMRLDQRSGDPSLQTPRDVTRDRPLGQTFVTGPRTRQLCRIAICHAWWNKSWTEDESLVLTVWDSPKKQEKIASYAMPYKWRRWEGAIMMFPIWQKIEPSHSYYMELTVTGGDGRIEGIGPASKSYGAGQAFVGGEPQDWDLFFETHGKDELNPEADYGRLFALWDLNYPGLGRVKELVQKKQWEAASYALVDYYENHRPDLLERPKQVPETRPADFTTKEADLALEMKTPAEEEGVADIGPDWNHYAIWPTRGGVGLTRGGIRKYIANTYRCTGDRKYAKLWNEVNYCCLRDQPNPVEAGVYPKTGSLPPAPPAGIAGGSMWSSLSIGPRASFGFVYYRWFVDCPEFTPDVRAAFIFNLADMADVLLRHKAGGNWTTQIKSALMELAEQHPEWRDAKAMMEQGFGGLVENLLETVHPDGPLKEATSNYHLLTLNRFVRLLEQAGRLKVAVPEEARRRGQKAAEYPTFAVLPDFTVPLWGDSNPVTKPGDVLKSAAKLFGRPDMLWVATEGKQGTPPTVNSIAFPTAGYFVMRSGWTSDARYLALHNGHSTSHGHWDALGVIMAAHGRQLVVDPGVYIYGTEHARRLTRAASHSTVTVGDRDARNDNGKNDWASNAKWDYFAGTNAGYAGAGGTHHRRQIIFAKPDYWVVRDGVMGPVGGNIVSRFVLSDTQAEQEGMTIRTKHASGGNLAIIPAGGVASAHIAAMQRAASWDRLADCAVAEFVPAKPQWCTVLLPYSADRQPEVTVQVFESEAGQAVNVKNGEASDWFLFQEPGKVGTYDNGRIRFIGEAALIRCKGDRVESATGRKAALLEWGGQKLLDSGTPDDF
jgi:hypothetical protein